MLVVKTKTLRISTKVLCKLFQMKEESTGSNEEVKNNLAKVIVQVTSHKWKTHEINFHIIQEL